MEPSEDNAVAAAQTHSESSSGIRQSVCTVHVCTSCRPPGTPREPEENRPGFLLYRRLKEALKEGDFDAAVNVEPTPCLSVCPRPCGIALSLSGSWTYLFGDQDPEKTVRELLTTDRFWKPPGVKIIVNLIILFDPRKRLDSIPMQDS